MSFKIPEANILYIHIPKCAGNTMRKWFQRNFKVDPAIPNIRTTTNNYHSTINDAKDHLGTLDDLRLVTTVRNPWKRMFSWYCHLMRNTKEALNMKGPHGNINLNPDRDVLLAELKDMSRGFNYWLESYHDKPWHGTWFKPSHPQTHWIGNFTFDYVINMELPMEPQLLELSEKLGIPKVNGRILIRNANPDQSQDHKEHYNDDTKRLVERLHQTDIERFNFCF